MIDRERDEAELRRQIVSLGGRRVAGLRVARVFVRGFARFGARDDPFRGSG